MPSTDERGRSPFGFNTNPATLPMAGLVDKQIVHFNAWYNLNISH